MHDPSTTLGRAITHFCVAQQQGASMPEVISHLATAGSAVT